MRPPGKPSSPASLCLPGPRRSPRVPSTGLAGQGPAKPEPPPAKKESKDVKHGEADCTSQSHDADGRARRTIVLQDYVQRVGDKLAASQRDARISTGSSRSSTRMTSTRSRRIAGYVYISARHPALLPERGGTRRSARTRDRPHHRRAPEEAGSAKARSAGLASAATAIFTGHARTRGTDQHVAGAGAGQRLRPRSQELEADRLGAKLPGREVGIRTRLP